SRAFDMLNASSYNPAFVNANGGTAASAAAVLLAGIQRGQAYFNIHTQMFGGGEIRGFLAVPVDLSIKADSAIPPINTRSRGKIPVAILSTAGFNAVTGVDTTSLRFGPTGTEQSLAFCNSGGEDVNGDGLPDLVCHFETELTGFKSASTMAILMGK